MPPLPSLGSAEIQQNKDVPGPSQYALMLTTNQRYRIARLHPSRMYRSVRQYTEYRSLLESQVSGGVEVNFCFTCDTELIPPRQEGETFENRSDVTIEGVKALQKVLDEFDVKGTFFVEGVFAERFPDKVEELFSKGHEIGSHGYNHQSYGGVWKTPGLTEHPKPLNADEKRNRIEKTTRIIERITGERPTSFRAPYLVADAETLSILETQGYRVDSSVHNPVYGLSSHPFHPSKRGVHRRGERDIIEVPSTVVPSLIYRRGFPTFLPLTDLLYGAGVELTYSAVELRASLDRETRRFARGVIVPLTHPQEFIDLGASDPGGGEARLEQLKHLFKRVQENEFKILSDLLR